MGIFGKSKSSGYTKSGSPGKAWRGHEKGSISSNPKKHEARTDAQARRSANEVTYQKGSRLVGPNETLKT